jgi:hypothetical protein
VYVPDVDLTDSGTDDALTVVLEDKHSENSADFSRALNVIKQPIPKPACQPQHALNTQIIRSPLTARHRPLPSFGLKCDHCEHVLRLGVEHEIDRLHGEFRVKE